MTDRWGGLFTEKYPEKGATEFELQRVAGSLFLPLNDSELSFVESARANPFADAFHPRKWWLPKFPLPESYLDFLRWSNGGAFLTGERRFDPFIPVAELRRYLLSYHFPALMPGAVPFAMDGGGCFYVFDMRQNPVGSEFPILFTSAGNLGYTDAIFVANSFEEACRGATNPAYDGLD